MRRRIPFAITFRRPRKPEDAPPAKPSKRAPITALWDEMVSGAPVDLATADMNADTLLEERAWDGWAVADDVEAPNQWSGWAVADDADDHDDRHDVPTELVIRHVHGRTGPVLAVPFVQFAAVQPRTRVPSGIYVVPLSTEIEQLDDTPEDAGWDEPPAPITMPISPAPFRPITTLTPRHAPRRWHQGHVAIATLGLLLIVAAWRHSPPTHAADRPAPVVAVASESAPISQAEPAQIPAPATTLVAQPANILAPLPAAGPPLVASAQFVDPDLTSAPTQKSSPDPDFDYRSARRYIDEQASYLRETCMQKGERPRERLRVEVAVQPGGVARIAVPGVSAEIRGCVRRVLAFPFDPSPRGAQFVYTLTATRSHLKPRSETPTG